MSIVSSILDLIGNTPLVRLNSVVQPDAYAEVVAKLEYFNPASSVKDRLALAMIEDAEARGELTPFAEPKQLIVEPTSGNTGIGLAVVAAVKGYRVLLTMPETMSVERRILLQGLGAQLVLTPAVLGMRGAVEEAYRIVEKTEGAILLQQFSNMSGPEYHFRFTGEEIWRDCEGRVDIVVAGIGTGGTLTGIGKRLKAYNPEIKVIGVEPKESAVLSGGAPGPHLIQGLGSGFIPEVLDRKVIDGVITVSGEEAIATARRLIREEGLLVGISAGAAAHAAIDLARQKENKGKRIVFIVPDCADRYLSTRLFVGDNETTVDKR